MKYALHHRPVNANAAEVIKRGEHWETARKEMIFDTCPPTMPLGQAARRAGFVDYTGLRWGRLLVLAPFALQFSDHDRQERRRYTRWVCRCDCGHYVLRRCKVLNPARRLADAGACEDCNYKRRLRDGYVK